MRAVQAVGYLVVCGLSAQAPMITSFSAPGARFVVADSSGSKLATEARALLEGEDLVAFDLGFLAPGPAGIGYTVQQDRWPQGARWGVLNAAGRLVLSGDTLPKAAALAQQLGAAGISSPVRELRAFLAAHPEHLEARTRLLVALRRIAARRTAAVPEILAAGSAQASGVSYGFITVNPLGANPKLLPEDPDLRIWSAVAQEVDRAFRTGDWLPMGLSMPITEYPSEGHSPLMRGVFSLHLPKVDEALRGTPGSEKLWNLRAWMGWVTGRRGIRDLLGTIPAPPGYVLGGWPHGSGRSLYVAELRQDQAWSELRAFLLDRWPGWMPFMRLSLGSGRSAPSEGVAATEWELFLEPLLRSALKLKDDGTVTMILQALATEPGLRGLLDQSAGVVLQEGRKDLESFWKNPAPPSAQAPREEWPWLATLGASGSSPFGRLLVLEGSDPDGHEEGPLCKALGTVAEDESLLDWNLRPEPVPLVSGVARELCSREGWSLQQSRWCLLDAGNRVVAQGTQAPKAEALAKACGDAGLPSPLEAGRAFLRAHPDRQDALSRQQELLSIQARMRTRQALGPEVKSAEPGKPPRLLDESRDEAIWSEVEALTERWAEAAETAHGGLGRNLGFTPKEDLHSPRMRALCARLLPRVEAQLARTPGDGSTWWLWLRLAAVSGGHSVKALLDRLTPLPGTRLEAWPPMVVRAPYLRDCVAAGDGKAVEELAGELFKRILALPKSQAAPGKAGLPSPLHEDFWNSTLTFLLESRLRRDDLSGAQRLLDDWLSAGGWAGAREQASALARKLKMEDLAERWRKGR